MQRRLQTDESGVGSIQSEKAGCEEAEKRKEGFPFQIVGVGSERKGGRGNQGIEWRACRVRGGTAEVPNWPGNKEPRCGWTSRWEPDVKGRGRQAKEGGHSSSQWGAIGISRVGA